MGGIRNWKGYKRVWYNAVGHPRSDTTYSLSDTTFEILVIDESTVTIFNKTYPRTDADSQNIIFFGSAWAYRYYHEGEGIMYFYTHDSIAVVKEVVNKPYRTEEVYYTVP